MMSNSISKLATSILKFSDENRMFDCSHIIVGLSGGPDSVALISILKEISDYKSSRGEKFPVIHAVHINHNIRGLEADEDEAFSKAFSGSLDIPFVSFSLDVPKLAKENHRSVEEMGRIVRYDSFYKVAESYESYKIAVAHHADDLSETMLMNIFRGTGLEGLVSPKASSDDIVRPLLLVTKDELISYLNDKNISYRVDSTNLQDDVTRNAWRNSIIPQISEVSNKKPSDALGDLYSLLSDDLSFIESYVDETYSKLSREVFGHPYLKVKEVLDLPSAIKSRVIRKLWLAVFGNLTDFTKVHIDLIVDYLGDFGSGSGLLDLPFERVLYKNNGEFTFVRSDMLTMINLRYTRDMGFVAVSERTEVDINVSKTTKIPNCSVHIDAVIVENIVGMEYNYLSWYFPFNGDLSSVNLKVSNDLCDKSFRAAGSSCSKKIGKLFSDLHVPKNARDSILAVCFEDDVLWIPGIGHAVGFCNQKSFEAWKKNTNNGDKFIKFTITECE